MGVESDALSRGTSSSSTTGPVDVGLSLLGRLHLDDEVDVGDVKTSGGDVSGDKNLELALLESLHGDLSLVLSDVSMHDLDVVLDLVRQEEAVGVSLRLGEHDHLATLSIDSEDVSQGTHPVLERTHDGEMGHLSGCLVLQVLSQIDDPHSWLHVGGSHLPDPAWDGCREQTDLEVSATLSPAFRDDL